MLKSPFSTLNEKQERNTTTFLIVFTAVFIGILRYFDSFLTNSVAPAGIVSFELTFDAETATAILNSWDKQALTAAGLSTGFDFIFPFLYASLIAMLVHKLNRANWISTSFESVGNLISWSLALAILCDFIENIGMIQMMLGNKVSTFWATTTSYFAVVKFSIILVGIGYILINFMVFLIKKAKK